MNKKFKSMIPITIYILVALFILQQCTSINITSASIFKSSKLDTYPYLKDGVISDDYTIQRLPSRYDPKITYNATHNFFLVEGDDYFKKIDGNGNELITIKKEEHKDGHTELATFTHYLFNENGVYDLSEEDIKEVLFKEIINQDRSLEPKTWIQLFDEYYKAAQVVVFGEELPYKDKQDQGFPVYFRIGKEWTKLFTKRNELRARGIDALKYNHKGYPPKFTRTIVLKDSSQKTFSNNEQEHYVHLYENKESSIKNYAFKYNNTSKIKSIFFEKEFVYATLAGGYTPIPISYTGTAYYKLKIKNSTLRFKEKAIKPIFKGLENHFYWYILPDAYFQNTDVSFLKFQYPSNHNNSGSNGLYIVKKIKDKD